MVSALPTAKAKTYLSDAKESEGVDKNNVEEKLAAFTTINFHSRNAITENDSHLNICVIKLELPMSYSSIPDRPPKR